MSIMTSRTARAALSVLFALLLLSGCDPRDAPGGMNLEQVLLAHTEALGGASAIENVAALEIDVRIKVATLSVNASYKATRDGRMRIDIYDDDQRVFTEAYDGKSGWQFSPRRSAASDMSPEGEAALNRGIVGNIFGLHERRALMYELLLSGQESIDGTEYWTIESKSPDGFQQRI